MKLRPIQRIVLVCGALLVLTAPAAIAQPRAVIAGDDADEALPVAFNGSKLVKNVHLTTVEGPAVDVTSCDGNSSSDSSVWFAFQVPAQTAVTLDIDTSGSMNVFNGGASTTVMLSLYQFGGSWTEIDCSWESGARLTNIFLLPGSYRVRVATDQEEPMLAGSQYRISLRVRAFNNLLKDSGFADAALGVYWKAKSAGTPPQVFRTCGSVCIVRFAGIAGGKLQQTLKLDPAAFKFKTGDLLYANMNVNGTPVTGADVKLTLQITYSNGTPATKVTDTRELTEPSPFTTTFGGLLAKIAHKSVKSIKVTITSPTAADTFSVVSVHLNMLAGTVVRDAPPPPSP